MEIATPGSWVDNPSRVGKSPEPGVAPFATIVIAVVDWLPRSRLPYPTQLFIDPQNVLDRYYQSIALREYSSPLFFPIGLTDATFSGA